MAKETIPADEKVIKKHPPEQESAPVHDLPEKQETAQGEITRLQQQIGNQAVQRLLAQQRGSANASQSFDVEDETAQRIEHERGGGQALDSGIQRQMGASMGFDFNQVKVHASPEADALNQDLGAEAFTTGNDIYFREGAYDPGSSKGRQLLAHEMTHVVQQSSGEVGDGGSKMTVNAPDDAYEKKADAVAHEVMSSSGEPKKDEVQMQAAPEEEDELKEKKPEEEEEKLKKGLLEDEEMQMKRVQLQELPEEEEEVQMKQVQLQAVPDEEEEVQMKRVQLQQVPEEEEEVQTKRSH